jgi:hypothetical protein
LGQSVERAQIRAQIDEATGDKTMKAAKKRFALRCTLAVAMSVASCVPSLNPLYTDDDLIFDPALVGVWGEENKAEETWAFEKSEGKAYKLVYTEKGKKGEFKVHLFKLSGTMFIDLFPTDASLDQVNDFYKGHLVPVHTFARVTQIEPTLQMAFLNPKWMEELAAKDARVIEHKKIDEDRILLTATTKDLQKFVLAHANDKDAFGEEPSNLIRLKGR